MFVNLSPLAFRSVAFPQFSFKRSPKNNYMHRLPTKGWSESKNRKVDFENMFLDRRFLQNKLLSSSSFTSLDTLNLNREKSLKLISSPYTLSPILAVLLAACGGGGTVKVPVYITDPDSPNPNPRPDTGMPPVTPDGGGPGVGPGVGPGGPGDFNAQPFNIFVADGIIESALVYVDVDEDVKATFDDNEIQLVASLVAIARLKAEAEGAEEITFPPGLENSALEVVTSERSLFKKRTGALNASLTVIDQNIRENEMLAENLKERVEIIKPLVEKGYEPKLTLLELESNYEQTVLAAQKARDEYKATVDNFRADAASQLAEHEVAARQAGAREDAYLAKVRHADVRAPSNGIVTSVKVKTVGAVLQAGTVLAEIVPDEQSLLIRARLPADDVANVYPGRIAQVSLSTYDVSRYGSLEGLVQRIAQNTTQEEGIPLYYVTMIEVPNPKFSKSETPVEITTGTPTVIDIIGKKRTVLSYILTPLERAAGVAFREQ